MADQHKYVVRLVDCDKANKTGVQGDADEVRGFLRDWFKRVCQKASTKASTWNEDVQWLDSPPSAKPPNSDSGAAFVINLMIYFVQSPQDSVIRLAKQNKGTVPQKVLSNKDYTGWTWTEPGKDGRTTTEVYVLRSQPTKDDKTAAALQLARTAFHESMHNQLGLGDEMHRGSGFEASPQVGNSPSADNIAKMAAGIATLRPQWVEGFQAWKDNNDGVLSR
jgi:hypothetical protein